MVCKSGGSGYHHTRIHYRLFHLPESFYNVASGYWEWRNVHTGPGRGFRFVSARGFYWVLNPLTVVNCSRRERTHPPVLMLSIPSGNASKVINSNSWARIHPLALMLRDVVHNYWKTGHMPWTAVGEYGYTTRCLCWIGLQLSVTLLCAQLATAHRAVAVRPRQLWSVSRRLRRGPCLTRLF